MIQIAAKDVPGLSSQPQESLIVFHYCNQCSPFGWPYDDTYSLPGSYDVRLFQNVNNYPVDSFGILTESPLAASEVKLSEVTEIPGSQDLPIEIGELAGDDYPCFSDDFSDDVFPGLKHVQRSKIGGWPSWVQNNDWPLDRNGEKMCFLCQIDYEHGKNTLWGGGGYAYLFIENMELENPAGEMVIQDT